MDHKIGQVNEGFVLDDAGNMITTTYIDLRPEGERAPILALVKGCRREHDLEDGETVLISQPARFREYGEGLIQDLQEGFAIEESVTVKEERAAEATTRRAVSDINEARELSNSSIRMVERVTYSSKDTESKSLAYGKEWWIFCTSIEPQAEGWESWQATLPKEYDHVSVIGQPAKFAEALARMVTEQIGPQGKDGWLKNNTSGAEGERTKHKLQWVIHGPVIYTDHVYDELTEDNDGIARLAASIFTKHSKYAAQREYRFAVLNEGADEETVLLQISGMMRDALRRVEGGLIRTPPKPVETAEYEDSQLASKTNGTLTPTYKRTTFTERETERHEAHWETRTQDGQVTSSEGERRESVKERIVTQEHQPDAEDSRVTQGVKWNGDSATEEQPMDQPQLISGELDREQSDEEAVLPLALEERDWNGDRPEEGFTIPVVHRGTGRVYKSFEEAFSNPAYPMSPVKEAWQESASTPEEIAQTYRAIAAINWKMAYIREEHRQEVASAGWYAMHCIRNIYARLGDVVESVWIERERFVIIRLKLSARNATGRIVIGPSGAYAYCLQLPDSEVSGAGGETWGAVFFPIGSEIESFETFGWPSNTK